MGKKRRNRSKQDAMETEDAAKPAAAEAMDTGAEEGSKAGFGQVEGGVQPGVPRVKKPTVRRKLAARKKVMLEKALCRVEKTTQRIEKSKSKNEMKSVLKKMWGK